MACDHRRFIWLVAGGNLWWCYRCGAIRRAHIAKDGTSLPIDAKWTKPTGPRGRNPACQDPTEKEE
jgi:hypothetical protein